MSLMKLSCSAGSVGTCQGHHCRTETFWGVCFHANQDHHLLQPILLRRALRFAGGLPRHIWGFWSIWDHRFIDYWMNNHKSRAKKMMFTKAALTHRVPLIFTGSRRSLTGCSKHEALAHTHHFIEHVRRSAFHQPFSGSHPDGADPPCLVVYFDRKLAPKLPPNWDTHVMDTFGWDDPKWGSGSVEMLISCLETPPCIRCPFLQK